MARTFEKKGYTTHTIDNTYEADLKKDIMDIESRDIPFTVDIIWASPPCQCFSVASISTHWKGGIRAYVPKSAKCKEAMLLLNKTINLISRLKVKYWYIENPRGVMRKVIDNMFKKHNLSNYVRHTVTYCQYGDSRMKPTDIWTNNRSWIPKTMCKNGMSCHTAAPRGAKTGTQGLKDSYNRSILPKKLCEEIVQSHSEMT